MSGFSVGVMILWVAVSAGTLREYPVSEGHGGPHFVVQFISWDCGARLRPCPARLGKGRVEIIELGREKRIIWSGEWDGEEDDFQGMVREAKRHDSARH